ncbi:hypothetical protein [Nocardia sp. NPDC057455]|uniref:hypothetical protein n=1 Tax=Nocardia sp. NPDC057455 TaxID=3346138 RepID=UPI0036731412
MQKPAIGSSTITRVRALDLEDAFRRYLDSHGRALDNLDATTAIDSISMFYTDHRVTDVDLDNDMLLFQWGAYGNDQQEFVYDITRQVITGPGDDDSVRLADTLSGNIFRADRRSLGREGGSSARI